MKRVWVIRFTPSIRQNPLYLTKCRGVPAFSGFKEALGWTTKSEAEEFMEALLLQMKDDEVREAMKTKLVIEEHIFGDKRQ